jgi:hypothetical protein
LSAFFIFYDASTTAVYSLSHFVLQHKNESVNRLLDLLFAQRLIFSSFREAVKKIFCTSRCSKGKRLELKGAIQSPNGSDDFIYDPGYSFHPFGILPLTDCNHHYVL